MRIAPPHRHAPEGRATPVRATVAALFLLAWPLGAQSDDDPARDAAGALRAGNYEQAIALAAADIEDLSVDHAAWTIAIEGLLALGRYDDALARTHDALAEIPASVRLHLLGFEAARFAGQPDVAAAFREQIRALLLGRRRYIPDESHLVDLGAAALLLGAEPRLVLENFLKPGQLATPPVRTAFLLAGRLALEKGDDGLAARTFQAGLKAFPDDPDLLAGLAAAFLDGDRRNLLEFAGRALVVNPRHVAARRLIAEHLIDAEDLEAATAELDRITAVNPRDAEALALRAVIAHLRHDIPAARQARETALSTWKDNPRVDHLIGTKLAQRYRFAEAAEALRLSLARDALYTPARLELAQTLLRLGRDDEGWTLALEAQKADPYSVAAFNLAQLRDRVAGLAELRSEHFIVRLGAAEAPVYGDRALALLERARARLSSRYGLELAQPTTVEIFPDPKDFAVRTFGMPGVPGFLGVCFGPVVTVNSPATRRANWEAVLWHEFAHTITLALTRNRMPRWLSEGISVYEETQENAAWGQPMTIAWHQRITGGGLRPIDTMSAAFLDAQSPEDTQFAYFQSYLVVRHLIETHGFERLRGLLVALGDGEEANVALARLYGPLDALDRGFQAWTADEAARFAGGLDLAEPSGIAAQLLAALQPASYPTTMERSRTAMLAGEWTRARSQLEEITARGVYFPGEDTPHRLLARCCRELGDTAAEEAALRAIVAREADALDSVVRLHELARARADHPAVVDTASRWIAIQPLAETPWRSLLAAHEAAADARAATHAGRVLLALQPPDRAAIHHRIARQLRDLDPDAARTHVLRALEEAPRFRDALALLAELPAGDATP